MAIWQDRSPSLGPTAIARRDTCDERFQFATRVRKLAESRSSMRSDQPTRLRNDFSEWSRSLAVFAVVLCGWTPATDYKGLHKTLAAPRVAVPRRRHSIAVVQSKLLHRR